MRKDKEEQIIRIGKELQKQFQSNKRDNNENYFFVKNPEGFLGKIAHNIAFHVHKTIDNIMPNDLVYATVYETLGDLDCEPKPDAYTCDLKKFAMEGFADSFFDDAIRDFNPSTYFDILAYGNYLFKNRIKESILEYFS